MIRRTKLFVAGLAAFIVGMPLASETYAQGLGSWIGFIVDSSVYASDGDS